LNILAAELNVQVVSSSNDGLRYTFILERGQPDLSKDMRAPALAFPIEIFEHFAALSNDSALGNEHTTMHQRLGRFLKIAEALGAMDTVTTRPLPDVLFMDEAELNHQMAKYQAAQCSGGQ
jgi:hypothetical protein